MTPSGIKPATFRCVAQHLNHCAYSGPLCARVQVFKNPLDASNFSVAKNCFLLLMEVEILELWYTLRGKKNLYLRQLAM